jgi:replication factor A1
MSLFRDRCLKLVLSLINPEAGYFYSLLSVHPLSAVNFSIFTIFLSRENVFSQQVELNLGTRGVIRKSEKTVEVEYRKKFTDIANLISGKNYSVQGKVSEIGDLREFEREDETENAVATLKLKDETGSIKLTLWGDQAYVIESLDIDSEIQIINAYAKKGLYEIIELSVGNRS